MNKFWVIALETYKKQVKTVSFLIMILAPLLFLGISYGGAYFGEQFANVKEIAVVSENPEIQSFFIDQVTDDFDIDKGIKSEIDAKKALEKESIDGYLVLSVTGETLSGEYVGTKTLGMESTQIIQQSLNQLQLGMTSTSLSLSQEDVSKLVSPAVFSEKQIEVKDGKIIETKNNQEVMLIVGMVVVFMMYFIVILYSTITAQEVASEKGTRIMEVILSSTTASKHFYGKITGMFLVILTQVGIYLATGLLAYLFVKDTSAVQSFFKEVPANELLKGLLGYNLLYLLFGVLIYTILAAFLGSLVSKVEDSAKAAAPITYLTMIGFIGSFVVGMSNPQSIIITIMSYVPFLSSFAMPIRIANNEVGNTQVLISLGLLVVSIVLLLRLAAKAYKSTVLIYSDKSMFSVLKDGLKFSK